MIELPRSIISARAASLVQASNAFFKGRGLALDRLEETVVQRFPNAQEVVVTSSLVQGLATRTSDIDLIAILDEDDGGMATQIYVDGHHAEVALLRPAAVDAAFAALVQVAGQPPERAIAEMLAWDRSRPVRKKYLERLINGVALDGGVPHQDMFSALARCFATQALGRVLEAQAAMNLSLASGEARAPWIYALAAVDHARDLVLCSAGYVYQNRKWIGSRWRMHHAAALESLPELTASRALADLAKRASQALDGGAVADLPDRISEVTEELSHYMGCDARVGLRCDADVIWRKMDASSGIAIGAGRAALLGGAEPLPEWIALDEARVSDAARYLAALRAGLMGVGFAA